MVFMGHKFILDDVTKAHVCIKSKSPVITSGKLYQEILAQSDTQELNVDVKPSEIGDFVVNLSDEIKARRACLTGYKKIRVSDVQSKPDMLTRANIVLVLPRTLSNQNLTAICNMLAYTVPLDIHFYIILPTDATDKIAQPISDKCYWVLDEDTSELQHK